MSFKTILVHLNDERRAGAVLDAALHVADEFEAHLIGVFVVPPGLVGSATGYGGRLVESGRQAFREEAKRVGAAFETAAKGRAVVADWRIVDPSSDHPGCADCVIAHGRSADLIVASQSDPSWDYSLVLDCPERLAVESGRPTLVVPHAGRFPHFGKRAIVAWNGSRESARAAFDALPLLQAAERVHVLSIRAQASDGESPATDLAAALARHGVKCEAAQSVSAPLDVGTDLLNRITDFSADLLVMGCYGHSRFRELVLGGASREVLRHMTVPVLFSH